MQRIFWRLAIYFPQTDDLEELRPVIDTARRPPPTDSSGNPSGRMGPIWIRLGA